MTHCNENELAKAKLELKLAEQCPNFNVKKFGKLERVLKLNSCFERQNTRNLDSFLKSLI